jgi:hypothetical protein
MKGTPERLGGRPRENEDDAYATFMDMSHETWWAVIASLMNGGVLTPTEDAGFRRALRDRGHTEETMEL